MLTPDTLPTQEITLAPGVLFPMGNQTAWWRVLDVDTAAMTALVIAERTVGEIKVDNYGYSAAREWMNGEYLQTTFSEDEIAAMLTTEIPVSGSESDDPPTGGSTADRIFLLDEKQVRRYLKRAEDRVCGGKWLVRKSDECSNEYTGVESDGAIRHFWPFRGIHDKYIMYIRPALRIDLHSDFFRQFICSEEHGIVKLCIPRHHIREKRLLSVRSEDEEIFVPDGVEELGSRCFADVKPKSVSLPSSVKKIAADAVPGCEALETENLYGAEKLAVIYAAMVPTAEIGETGEVHFIRWTVRGEDPEPADRENLLKELLSRAENDSQWYVPYAILADEERSKQLRSQEKFWHDLCVACKPKSSEAKEYRNLIARVRGARLLNDAVPVIPPAERFRPGICFPFGRDGAWWRVLAVDTEAMTALLLADDIVRMDAYDQGWRKVNSAWKSCELRKLLNETYFTENFSEEEQKMILETAVPNRPNPKYNTPGGNNTTDRLFLLSIEEIEHYLPEKTDRICLSGNCWWLRAPGRKKPESAWYPFAASVHQNGEVNLRGTEAATQSGVRPACWIDLRSEAFRSLQRKAGGSAWRAVLENSLSETLGIEMFI